MPAKDPNLRRTLSQIAAHSLHATVDGREHVSRATAKSPARLDYWEAKVDPTGTLPVAERIRRAEHAKAAHFKRMALKSAESRRKAKAS